MSLHTKLLAQFGALRRLQVHQYRILFNQFQKAQNQIILIQSIGKPTASSSSFSSSSRRTFAVSLRYDKQQFTQKSPEEMDAASYTVHHDTQKNFFFILLDESDLKVKAKLEYDWITPTSVDLYHTEVPPQCQGKGIAKYLAKAAFDHFSDKNITMRPSCTYLQKYIRENRLPRYVALLEKDFMKLD